MMDLTIILFFFFRNLHTVSYSAYTISHQERTRLPFSTSLSILLSLVFLMTVILTCVQWYAIMVFICILNRTRDVEQLSCTCGQSIYVLWESIYSGSLHILCSVFVFFLLMGCNCYLYTLYINP